MVEERDGRVVAGEPGEHEGGDWRGVALRPGRARRHGLGGPLVGAGEGRRAKWEQERNAEAVDVNPLNILGLFETSSVAPAAFECFF